MDGESRDAIVEAVLRGQVVWPGHPDTAIPHDDSYTGYADDAHTGPKGEVRAEDIREALRQLAADGSGDPRGLRVRDATITGTLDLNWFTLPFPLAFEGCEFDEWIWTDHLTVPQLVLDSCRFESFGGTGLRVGGRLLIFQCTGVKQIFLPDARLGIFELRPESFVEPSAPKRFELDGARIDELIFAYDETLGAGGAEGQARYAVASDVFDNVELERLVLRSPDDEPHSAWAWLRGGRRTSPGDRLAAWLADEPQPPETQPALPARSLGWFRRWLAPRPTRRYVPRTWRRFAEALDAAGMGDEARHLRIDAERFRVRAQTGRLRQLLSTVFFDLPIRYGYRNGRVGWILLALLAVATVIVQSHRSSFVPTNDLAGGYPGLWPVAYALDVVASPINTGQSEAWWTGASPGVAASLITIKLMSWVLGGIFIGGVSSRFNRSA